MIRGTHLSSGINDLFLQHFRVAHPNPLPRHHPYLPHHREISTPPHRQPPNPPPRIAAASRHVPSFHRDTLPHRGTPTPGADLPGPRLLGCSPSLPRIRRCPAPSTFRPAIRPASAPPRRSHHPLRTPLTTPRSTPQTAIEAVTHHILGARPALKAERMP